MELVLIDPNSDEWNYMWQWLADHPINKDIPEPTLALNENEGWQYMGTYANKNRYIHSFRHKNHPLTKNIQTLNLTASENCDETQIYKRINL